MSDVLISCENVSKIFCRDLKRSLWYGVKDVARECLLRDGNSVPQFSSDIKLRPGEFFANKDISFEVKRGECLGLIGGNGAGKTTLLKMLNGLIKPDTGRIEMVGKVGALIALGAGFNPILTGRENVFVNGSVLGLSRKQIREKFDEIVEFAELAEFIDTPVRSYSSGMQVRLGFAVAAILLKPDVLLLDEVLAVGDAAFRQKCYFRMSQLMSSSAVILVSHSMEFISQCCSRVGLLEKGTSQLFDEPIDGIQAYEDTNSGGFQIAPAIRLNYPISQVDLKVNEQVSYRDKLEVTVQLTSEEDISDIGLSFSVVDRGGQNVMCWHSRRGTQTYDIRKGKQFFEFAIDPVLLHDGSYRYTFNITKSACLEHIVWMKEAGTFRVTSDFRPVSRIPYLPAVDNCTVTYFE